MKKITWSLWLLIGGLTGLYLLADTLWPAQGGFFAFRTVWVQYSGVLAMGMMSVATQTHQHAIPAFCRP